MLSLRHIGLVLNGKPLVRPFSLDVAPGEVVTLMGASGSGKSSLLAFIAGDLPPAMTGQGDVVLNRTRLNPLPPERRGLGRLFQDDYLFPHMTVGENLLFAVADLPRAERLQRMEQALTDCGLEGFAPRPPHSLSGGQRSRVALMRALLAEPAAILLDEPFSKLDRPLRASMRSFTFEHIRNRGIPALLVSHDPEDVPPGGRVLEILEDGSLKNA
ncbi:MAG: ATP-binding cassette domain-containing protein [Rhizobiales bacterium]|nr:ATP-binding cassette domain-containing protein [Hyphomicrobiales bacterium]